MNERSCDTCQGNMYRVIEGHGAIDGWLQSSGARDHWFCPSCDWGKNERARAIRMDGLLY